MDLTDAQIEYDEMRQVRQELVWSVPIVDQRITRLDMQLINHPLTSLPLLFEIYSRLLFVGAVIYEHGATSEEKRKILLQLRWHFDEFRKIPEWVQELLRPTWLTWNEVLNGEEERLKERANGRA
jgi:hypothetical protein